MRSNVQDTLLEIKLFRFCSINDSLRQLRRREWLGEWLGGCGGYSEALRLEPVTV